MAATTSDSNAKRKWFVYFQPRQHGNESRLKRLSTFTIAAMKNEKNSVNKRKEMLVVLKAYEQSLLDKCKKADEKRVK